MTQVMGFLRVSNIAEITTVNGPGKRFAIWTQGCPFKCRGCFNPETHDPNGGHLAPIDKINKRIAELAQAGEIEGITFSGGEPLLQWAGVREIVKHAAALRLTILIFTGFEIKELQRMPAIFAEIGAWVDVVIAGRFQESKRIAHNLIGSANKQVVFFSDVYELADSEMIPACEVIISQSGELTVTGIDPGSLQDDDPDPGPPLEWQEGQADQDCPSCERTRQRIATGFGIPVKWIF